MGPSLSTMACTVLLLKGYTSWKPLNAEKAFHAVLGLGATFSIKILGKLLLRWKIYYVCKIRNYITPKFPHWEPPLIFFGEHGPRSLDPQHCSYPSIKMNNCLNRVSSDGECILFFLTRQWSVTMLLVPKLSHASKGI